MLGLLYDFHGNLRALDAVLTDAGEAGVGRFLLGGDYALFGPEPRETVARLRDLDATWIRGNVDRWTAEPGDVPDDPLLHEAIEHCRAQLGEALVGELAALAETHVEPGVRFSHGSPASDVFSFAPEPSDADEELLAGRSEPLQVFGHTHLPFERPGPGGVRLVNPGSVGMPMDGDQRAAWAILHDDGRIEHRRVAYDHRSVVADLRSRGEAWADRSARRVERARFVE